MSHYGVRFRGRGGRGGSARPGLLGDAPGSRKPRLLDSLGTHFQPDPRPSQFHEPQHFKGEQPRPKQGLLGNAPSDWQEPTGSYERPQQQQHRQHHEPRQSDYSYQEPEQYHDRGYDDQRGEEFQEQPKRRVSSRPLPPEIQRIMANLGLTKADMEELSRLPEKDLSSGNLLQVIQNLREKKAAASSHSAPSPHDRGHPPSRQEPREGHAQRSFGARDRSPDHNTLYDPSEPTDEYGNNERYEDQQRYAEKGRENDAFSSFQEKWYSEKAKTDGRDRSDVQPAGSILRGSRGPVAKPTRWERDDHPPPAKQPRRPSPRTQHSPPPVQRLSPLMQRRRSPVPVRIPSPLPQRRHSPPRRLTPPPRRMTPPPRRMNSPPRMPQRRGGLLGDPHDPSTQELDLLAATINHNRPPVGQDTFQPPPERSYLEPEAFRPRMRSRSPPPRPLLQQPVAPPHGESSVLQAQMQAMQVLQSEAMQKQGFQQQQVNRGGGPTPRVKGERKLSFTKEEAQAEAAKMRKEEGRVLYLRYRAGGMDVIREEHLVKLSQPFEKVTNILLVAPKNLKTGWYQAFLELAHFDGAAAMCEHFMARPPVVEGISVQVQRSKYRDLQLREHQMNRNFDKLLQPGGAKKRRPRSLSPGQPKNKAQKSSSVERRSFSKEREKKSSAPKKSEQKSKTSDSGKSSEKREEKECSKQKEASPDAEKQSDKVEDKTKKPDGEKSGSEVTKDDTTLENGTDVAKVKADTKGKKVIDSERLEIIRENIEQATNMSEALLKIVQQKSTKAIISEILEYLGDSLDQLKGVEEG